jgi:2-polyprenyl-6-hydroxyphenyl methylase/3-demethylubiquinone-9 3-methyltransferase
MTVITSEIDRFNRLSATWWDSRGPMRPLHVLNALRLDHVLAQIALHLKRDTSDATHAMNPMNALLGLRILGVGCGGGLLSEALAYRGAQVVGVDASEGNISAARLHAQSQGVTVDYRLGEPSQALAPQDHFDVVLALEVVEHVSDVPAFLATTAACLSPRGMLFVSTIDRTFKSFVVAILGAEYLLRVLPRGTHQWSMFVRPHELNEALVPAGLERCDLRGMRYVPLLHRASWCRSTQVNYIATYAHGTVHDPDPDPDPERKP